MRPSLREVMQQGFVPVDPRQREADPRLNEYMTCLEQDILPYSTQTLEFLERFGPKASDTTATKRKKNELFGPLHPRAATTPKLQEEWLNLGEDIPGLRPELSGLYSEAFHAAYAVAATQPWLKGYMMKQNVNDPDKVPGLMSGALFSSSNRPSSQTRTAALAHNPARSVHPYYTPEDIVRRYRGPYALQYAATDPRHSKSGDPIDFRDHLPHEKFRQMFGSAGRKVLRADFGNCAARRDVLTWDTTHVAVGFGDMISGVVKARIDENPDRTAKKKLQTTVAVTSSGREDGCSPEQVDLRYIGIDMSAYACAKAEVIAGMLSDKAIPVSHVIQVWFSATWTRDALDSFVGVVRRLQDRMRADLTEIEQACRAGQEGDEGTSTPRPSLLPGMLVRVDGLQSAAGQKLNGRVGCCVDRVSETGRWRVNMVSLKNDAEIRAIKDDNLRGLGVMLGKRAYIEVLKYVECWAAACERFLGGASGGSGAVGTREPVRGSNVVGEAETHQPSIAPGTNGAATTARLLGFDLNVAFNVPVDATDDDADSPRGNADPPKSAVKTVKDARHLWFRTRIKKCPERALYFLGSLRRKIDRECCMRYMATGDVFTDFERERPEVGSVVMWTLPDDDATVLDESSALGLLSMEEYVEQLDKKGRSSQTSLMQLFSSFFEEKLGERFRGKRAKNIRFEFLCEEVGLGEDEEDLVLAGIRGSSDLSNSNNISRDPRGVVQEPEQEESLRNGGARISATGRDPITAPNWSSSPTDGPVPSRFLLEKIGREFVPWTMSWSNCIDYFRPSCFHKIGRICSQKGDVMHFGFSMNWPTEVYGCSIMDYGVRDSSVNNADQRLFRDYYLDVALSLDPNSANILPFVTHENRTIRDVFCHYPLCDDPENLCAYSFAHSYYRDWIKHFFGEKKCPTQWRTDAEFTAIKEDYANPNNCGMSVGTVTTDCPHPMARISTAVATTWTYDPAIRMQTESQGLAGNYLDHGGMHMARAP